MLPQSPWEIPALSGDEARSEVRKSRPRFVETGNALIDHLPQQHHQDQQGEANKAAGKAGIERVRHECLDAFRSALPAQLRCW